jgi:response regulator RpfG family c-di-GMP phosphodiesterase
MTMVSAVANPSMNVLSVEDQIDTIRGPLDTLAFDGCAVKWSDNVGEAENLLQRDSFDFLILDQRVTRPNGVIDHEAGSSLAIKLKAGELGPKNVDVPFVFVTGSHEWVEESEMVKLPGYRGVLVKASDVTTKLRTYCAEVLQLTDPSAFTDRVLVRVVRVDSDGIHVIVPSWSLEAEIRVAAEDLPPDVVPAQLEGARLFARMDLSVENANQVRLDRWEQAEPLEEDDGLA